MSDKTIKDFLDNRDDLDRKYGREIVIQAEKKAYKEASVYRILSERFMDVFVKTRRRHIARLLKNKPQN